MNATSQGVQFRGERNQMGTIPNMHIAAPTYIPDHGLRSSDQHYSVPRPHIQAPTIPYTQHNTAQTYQIPPPASNWGPGPGSVNRHGHIQPPIQRPVSSGIASHYPVNPYQGYQNAYTVHLSGSDAPRIGTHHSMMTEQGPNHGPYSIHHQARFGYTATPNGGHPYTQPRPSSGRPRHPVDNYAEHDWASGTVSQSEKYTSTQNFEATQTNINHRPGNHAGGPDYPQRSRNMHHISEVSSKEQNMQVTHHGQFLVAPTAIVGPAAAGDNIPPLDSIDTDSTPWKLSEADKAIKEAAEEVMSIFKAKESTLSEQPQSPYRSPTPGSDSALSTPKAEWENPEYDPTRSQTVQNDDPEEGSVARPIELDQASNRESVTSSAGAPEAPVKRKRGRPNLEEQ